MDLKNFSNYTSGDEKIFIIHENEDWTRPLKKQLDELSLPYEEWYPDRGTLDLSKAPPMGVFYNRMSASSHTRDHRYAPEFTGPILSWLESYGRKVLNGRKAMQLETRKAEQYIIMEQYDIKTPRTIIAVGDQNIINAADNFLPEPFILKPNRGGKGAGVELIRSHKELLSALENNRVRSLDGITLIQEYIKPANESITRLEFIGGELYYAVQVDTSQGFELCPADPCQAGDAFCPAGENEGYSRFRIIENYSDENLDNYLAFLSHVDMDVAAMEFVENEKGEKYFYDVNINTNYNTDAESFTSGLSGMKRIAQMLSQELYQTINKVA